MDVLFTEIDRPIEGYMSRRDVRVVGLRCRIFEGYFSRHRCASLESERASTHVTLLLSSTRHGDIASTDPSSHHPQRLYQPRHRVLQVCSQHVRTRIQPHRVRS